MKMPTPPPYLDRLDSVRREVFYQLAAFSPPFVLAGGTAIMLQLGHRLSYDFDNFSESPLPTNLLRKIRRVFGNNITQLVDTGEVLSIKTVSGVEVTFVYHPYPPLLPVVKTGSIPLFHLDDLAANKAYTIGRRGAWRDYVDLFLFLKWDVYSLEHIIALAKRKFGGEFQDKLFLEQLVYFSDLKIIPTFFLKESFTPEQTKNFLSQIVDQYVEKVFK